MQESIVFLLRVQCRRKESSRSLSHLLMSFFNFLVDFSKAISRKRCKIIGKLILMTNRKSHELSIGTKLGLQLRC